jgi:chromosomal replication initiator protein
MQKHDATQLIHILLSAEGMRKIKMTPEAINYIVNRSNQNIYLLISMLNKIMFFAHDLKNSVNDTIITFETISNILLAEEEDKNTIFICDPNIIIEKIVNEFGLKKEELISKTKKRSTTQIRDIAIWAIKKKIKNIRLAQIGNYFNNRKHPSIIQSLHKTEKLFEKDKEIETRILNLIKKI